jgi:hypothetical protein
MAVQQVVQIVAPDPVEGRPAPAAGIAIPPVLLVF